MYSEKIGGQILEVMDFLEDEIDEHTYDDLVGAGVDFKLLKQFTNLE